MPTVTAKNTPQCILNIIQRVINAVAGHGPDPTNGLVQGMQLRMGAALLSQVKQDFIVKSTGATGVDGTTWKPLSPVTIAQRRLGAEDRKKISVRARTFTGRPTDFTPAEQKRMAKEIKRRQADLIVKFGVTPGQAKGLARAQVENKYRQVRQVFGRSHTNIPWITSGIYTNYWQFLKLGHASGQSPGGIGHIQSKFSILSTRHVLILRDTQELLRAFSPGVDGDILEALKGKIRIGVSKKPWHHAGSRNGKLPSRPYWPRDGNLPSVWWDAIFGAAQRGVVDIIKALVKA